MATIGFVGLGAMGTPIAINLLRAGNQLAVYDLNASACERLVREGARRVSAPAEAAQGCEVFITLLPTSVEVAQVLEGEAGALSSAARGTLFIDMGTGRYDDFMRLRSQAATFGQTLIDSPIARGPDFAAAREILFLVGAEAEELERARAVLHPVCEEVVDCGPPGSGLKTKIINNYLAAVSVAANAEALALADAVGLDRDFLRTLWKRTVAGRGALETVFPTKALVGDYSPGFSARLARKDLHLAQALGQAQGLGMLSGAAAQALFDLQDRAGRIDEDWTALLDVLQRGRRADQG